MAKEVISNTKPSRTVALNTNRNLVYALLGILILVAVFMSGAAIANHNHKPANTALAGPASGYGAGFGGRARGLGGPGGGFGGSGGAMQNSGQNRTSGVVTALTDSGFTLAGNGTTTNVTTDGSTQYQNGTAVKVNDSVLVFGTTSNGTISATSVIINPQSNLQQQ